jgi:hypothetical protein
MARIPSSVEMVTDMREPMTTTKMIAASVRPNHKMASGSQQMEGSACSPAMSGLIPRSNQGMRALASPKGMPIATESR